MVFSPDLLLAAAAPKFETTLVGEDAISFGTFQSNNQKVVRNERGVFMTHIRSRNEKYTAQQWRLSWSRDGGKSFTTLFESTDATNPPVLETDSANNLYLAWPDFANHNTYVLRFLATENYRTPHATVIPKSSAGKFAMMLDEPRQQICFLVHSGVFNRVSFDGKPLSQVRLNTRGSKATMEYPLLSLDANGVLHCAWTSLNVPIRRYWGIHHIQSSDCAVTWKNFAGQSLTLPVIADETGPSDRITLDDEFDVSTWLSSFLVKNGKAHFLYMARTKPPRQHHVRYDVVTSNREIDHQPELRGEKLSLGGLDGFFSTRSKDPKSPLFCISQQKGSTRIGCLRSDDNGQTWKDHALSEPFRQPYAIGGCREITPDGSIIGSFTDVTGEQNKGGAGGRVHFFRISAD